MKSYIIPDNWSVIESGFDPENVKRSESIFSIGNGLMGQRANFEERYTGSSLQGNYVGGVYYPDKTIVGWWKNGYPEYFAKVLNAPNWIGIDVIIDGKHLDLNTLEIDDFERELNMREGWLKRKFRATFPNGNQIQVESLRFLCLDFKEIGVVRYSVTPLNFDGNITFIPYLDANVWNQDANYGECFWEFMDSGSQNQADWILSKTLKTNYTVCTGMLYTFKMDNDCIHPHLIRTEKDKKIYTKADCHVKSNQTYTIYKYGGCTNDIAHDSGQLTNLCIHFLEKAVEVGFYQLLENQRRSWEQIWNQSDIAIEGDKMAQQGIRFNIFQLNQTYSGNNPKLNIGPKGFTGEKYGGGTYWDTEAYCLPFYMATKGREVAKNLLLYRYHQLDKAIENARKLGFKGGAALYPMVTMNGEECHNEWEITFEEVHRNGAIVYAIYNYVNYTGDEQYILTNGAEVIIGVAKFWGQRFNFSTDKNQYVILGVTGPNEYENNVNNNFYTNYMARWCLKYALKCIDSLRQKEPDSYERIRLSTQLTKSEIELWKDIVSNTYLPFCNKSNVFLQQEGFLDKELIPIKNIPQTQRPINQHWSWDRILRSCYIKQADVLQGIYFFEDQFSKEEITRHFYFYEPLTVHESSLSPCVHSIIACSIDDIEKAYELYLRTSRLDLDDYNSEVHEGLHITSMAGKLGCRSYTDSVECGLWKMANLVLIPRYLRSGNLTVLRLTLEA